jgi:hypothetical protein
MATVIRKPNGSIEIRYLTADGNRRSLYPGKIAKREAESVGRRVDHIVSRQITGSDPDRNVAEWLAALPGKLYSKLVKAGLAAARIEVQPEPQPESVPTIKQWTDQYIKNHTGKPETIEPMGITVSPASEKRLETSDVSTTSTQRTLWIIAGNSVLDFLSSPRSSKICTTHTRSHHQITDSLGTSVNHGMGRNLVHRDKKLL